MYRGEKEVRGKEQRRVRVREKRKGEERVRGK